MRTFAGRFLENGPPRLLFDAIPMPTFVVDRDVSILEYNAAAARLLGPQSSTILYRRSGEALHCVHAMDALRGCGHSPACADCGVREAVTDAAWGRQALRKWVRFEKYSQGERTEVDLRVSALPVTYEGVTVILLFLEGLEG